MCGLAAAQQRMLEERACAGRGRAEFIDEVSQSVLDKSFSDKK